MARTPPSSVTCYSSHLSHLQFPISLPPTPMGSTRVGPLTSSTVASSITILPEDNSALATLDILAITSLPSPEAPMLRVQYRNEGEGPVRASLAFLTEGITWQPSYVVTIEPKLKTLRLAGRVTIISSLPFLDDVTVPDLTLVSGSPTIVCQGQVDSLVKGEEIRRGRAMKRGSPAYSATSPDRSRSRSRERPLGKLEEHRLAEFYHFVIKDVPFHHQRPTSVAFMEELTSVCYNEFTRSSSIAPPQTRGWLLLSTSCNFPPHVLPPFPRVLSWC